MNTTCANTYYIDKHLEELSINEKELEYFFDSILDELEALESAYYELLRASKQRGYDFSEELGEEIRERLSL